MQTELWTADQVRDLLDIDRSTVYRMASDGRLPAVKIGRQWRFPRDRVRSLLETIPVAPSGSVPEAVIPGASATSLPSGPFLSAVTDPVAEALGVMMVVTDMGGRPVTRVSNPCPWFVEHAGDDEVDAACSTEWRSMADDPDLTPRFRPSAWGFLCARAFIRHEHELVGMVLAGGIAPGTTDRADDGLHHLDEDGRQHVIELLPRVASSLSRVVALAPSSNGHTLPRS